MKCRRCGAELLDTDTFCVKCGQKVEELPRCPKCGEILREGTKFCHKCGAAVGENEDAIQKPEDDEIPVTGTRTVDIPFDLIEKSIIMEAEQAVVKRDFTNYEKATQKDDSEAFGEKESKKISRKNYTDEAYKESNFDATFDENDIEENDIEENDIEEDDMAEVYVGNEIRKPYKTGGRPRYEGDYSRVDEQDYEEDYEEDDSLVGEQEYEGDYSRDYEQDDEPDYGEDDEDNRETTKKGIGISGLTVILGVAILILLVVLGIVFVKKIRPMQWERRADEATEQQKDSMAGKIQVIKNVNIRNQPDKENSSILGVAKAGEVYEFYELVNDNWYHIRLNDGSDGYVYKEYVNELSN